MSVRDALDEPLTWYAAAVLVLFALYCVMAAAYFVSEPHSTQSAARCRPW